MADSFYKDLSKLYFGSLIFPGDMKAENFYPDCVRFTIQKRIGVSIEAVTESFKAAGGAGKNAYNRVLTKEEAGKYPELAKTLDKIRSSSSGSSKKIIEENVERAFDAHKRAHPNSSISDSMAGVAKKSIEAFAAKMDTLRKRDLKQGKDSANILGSIYLNMPNGIQFNEAANWSGQELGFMGKTARDFVSGGGAAGEAAQTLKGAAMGSAGNMIGATIGAIPSLVSKLGISGGMFGAAIGAMAAGSPLQKGAEAALGVAQNPYMEMMFSGVGFRKFQFEFILRPKSVPEVDTVAKILKTLRTFTKPTFAQGDLGKSFMEYPMEFNIGFLTSSGGTGDAMSFGDNKNIPKLKNCVCDNVSSNFTPHSIWAAHKEGAPVAVNLSLSFQETELVMAEDVWKDNF